jgi:hypothetical protein
MTSENYPHFWQRSVHHLVELICTDDGHDTILQKYLTVIYIHYIISLEIWHQVANSRRLETFCMNTIRNLFRNHIVLSSFQKQTHIIYQLSLSWDRLCTDVKGML